MISVVVTLIVVGVLLWLVNTYIPMDAKIKKILNVVVVICVVVWASTSPEYGHHVIELLPVLGFVGASIKLVAGGIAISQLLKRRLVRPDIMAAIGGVEVVVAGLLFTFVRWLLPDSVSSLDILMGVILFMPVVRLSLAPLALDWNRHR